MVEKVIGRGAGLTVGELREVLARPRSDESSVERRDGPYLLLRLDGKEVAITQAHVRLLLHDKRGPACWWSVDVVIDEEAKCVRRGTQTFEPVAGREVTASMLRRDLVMGHAWHEALRLAAIGPDDKRFRSLMVVPTGQPREIDSTMIDRRSEEEAIAKWLLDGAINAGRLLSREELRRKLKDLRGDAVVPKGTVGQRLFGARKRGLLPPSDNGTRPTVESLRAFARSTER